MTCSAAPDASAPASAPTAVALTSALRAAAYNTPNASDITFVQMLRCVPSAPFGKPVVPDV